MWRNFHSLSCRSLAISSWHGGCSEKSYRKLDVSKRQNAQDVISPYKYNEQKKPNSLKVFNKTNQRREDFLSRSTGYRESTMCARITCSQRLAEVISWLLACSTQLNWKKRLLLLFLLLEPHDGSISIAIF